MSEETGYVAEKLIRLTTLYDNPVKDSNSIHLFVAENVIKSQQQDLDITEEIEVVLIPVSEVIQRILMADISVSGTITAIFLGLEYLHKYKLGWSNSLVAFIFSFESNQLILWLSSMAYVLMQAFPQNCLKKRYFSQATVGKSVLISWS